MDLMNFEGVYFPMGGGRADRASNQRPSGLKIKKLEDTFLFFLALGG